MRLSNLPPGVTGREPEITGDWPCEDCFGMGGECDEDGRVIRCERCDGSGLEPDE